MNPVQAVGASPIPSTSHAPRPIVVAPDLTALRGPLHGRWQLNLHLGVSARPLLDFANAGDREVAYQLVLLEAASEADLVQWLVRGELLRLWPHLQLPRSIRAAWQSQHGVLARAGATPGACITAEA